MHRSFSIILAVLLVVALAIPAFAIEYEGYTVPDVLPMMEANPDYPLAIVTYQPDYNRFNLYLAKVPVYMKSDGQLYSVDGDSIPCITYKATFGASSWGNRNQNSFVAIYPDDGFVLITSDVTDENGNIVINKTPVVPECDGSSCSATDANHDNICDDCGRVLTYNLRSTLLDFAKARAEFYSDTYPYYAITEHATNDKYLLVYLSQEPMIAGGTNYDTVTGTNMQWATVMENTDGSFGHTTIYSIDSWSAPLVYANHKIVNFLTPPLAVIIQGVTGEALEVTLPNLMSQIKTILLCGVGCLALFLLFNLLRSRLFPYLRG